MKQLENLTREELIKLIEVYARNWLAHDGCWFLTAEERFGLETAIELDAESWERFAVAEAKRIMKAFDIPSGGGLKSLEKTLRLRAYSIINSQQIEWVDDSTLIFRMLECRVQQTREQKGIPPFPCRPVGIVEFTQFSKTVDPRIKVNCLSCPPDGSAGLSCVWKFTL